MDVGSAVTGVIWAIVGVGATLLGRFAYLGMRNKNGVNSLKVHNVSVAAHPDMRAKLDRMDEKLERVDKTTIRIEAKLESVLRRTDDK